MLGQDKGLSFGINTINTTKKRKGSLLVVVLIVLATALIFSGSVIVDYGAIQNKKNMSEAVGAYVLHLGKFLEEQWTSHAESRMCVFSPILITPNEQQLRDETAGRVWWNAMSNCTKPKVCTITQILANIPLSLKDRENKQRVYRSQSFNDTSIIIDPAITNSIVITDVPITMGAAPDVWPISGTLTISVDLPTRSPMNPSTLKKILTRGLSNTFSLSHVTKLGFRLDFNYSMTL